LLSVRRALVNLSFRALRFFTDAFRRKARSTPLSALVSGPLVGTPWDDGAPRSVSVAFWEQACPPHERHVIYTDDAKAPVKTAPADAIFAHILQLLQTTPARCVELAARPHTRERWPQAIDM
jgi:hypothetical protein